MLIANIQNLARVLNAAADAADRLRKTPTITINVAPSDAALNDAIRRGRLNRSQDALKGKK